MVSSPVRCQVSGVRCPVSDLLTESGRATVLCTIMEEFFTRDQTPKHCLQSCLFLPGSQSPHSCRWFKFCQICNVSGKTQLCWVVIHSLPNLTPGDRKQTQGSHPGPGGLRIGAQSPGATAWPPSSTPAGRLSPGWRAGRFAACWLAALLAVTARRQGAGTCPCSGTAEVP